MSEAYESISTALSEALRTYSEMSTISSWPAKPDHPAERSAIQRQLGGNLYQDRDGVEYVTLPEKTLSVTSTGMKVHLIRLSDGSS